MMHIVYGVIFCLPAYLSNVYALQKQLNVSSGCDLHHVRAIIVDFYMKDLCMKLKWVTHWASIGNTDAL